MLLRFITLSSPLLRLAVASPGLSHDSVDWHNLDEILFARDTHNKFGYQDVDGPLVWDKLSPNNTLCGVGKNQSPINIVPGEEARKKGASLIFHLESCPEGASFENTGHTVQVNISGSVRLNRSKYMFQQFHFHTPSEHHLAGEHFPSEAHFVAKSKTGSLAVVSFLVELSNGLDPVSPFLAAALYHVEEIPEAGDVTWISALDPTDLEQHIERSAVYQYSGSLTTPPCSESVVFTVVANPLYIDIELYRSLKSVVKFNSRYIQNKPGQLNLLEFGV